MIDVAAAVIVHDSSVLLARRKGGYLHDLWEFPGGKLESGETPLSASIREIMEELSIKILPLENLLTLEHSYPDKNVRLHFVSCKICPTQEKAAMQIISNNEEVSWFNPEKFPLDDFCPADKIAAEKLEWLKILNLRKNDER
jgi:8-oxo-dGTP diphosphatase